MTPTLLGRWQKRLLLLPTIGLLVTLPFVLGMGAPGSWSYLIFLAYMGMCGLISDLCAQQFQKLRWDSDWPGLLQLAGAGVELLVLSIVLYLNRLPGINTKVLPIGWLLFQYVLVSFVLFIASHSLLRIFFPASRYRGGQWL